MLPCRLHSLLDITYVAALGVAHVCLLHGYLAPSDAHCVNSHKAPCWMAGLRHVFRNTMCSGPTVPGSYTPLVAPAAGLESTAS